MENSMDERVLDLEKMIRQIDMSCSLDKVDIKTKEDVVDLIKPSVEDWCKKYENELSHNTMEGKVILFYFPDNAEDTEEIDYAPRVFNLTTNVVSIYSHVLRNSKAGNLEMSGRAREFIWLYENQELDVEPDNKFAPPRSLLRNLDIVNGSNTQVRPIVRISYEFSLVLDNLTKRTRRGRSTR